MSDEEQHSPMRTDMSEAASGLQTSTHRITDIVFDMCGVLVDSQPWLALRGQYPQGVIDMVFDQHDPWGFDYFDAMLDSGWSEERVLSEYERHHGPAVAWVYRTYLERLQFSQPSMIPRMEGLLRDLDRQRLGLWGLTNFTTRAVNIARGLFPALGLLRDIVISSEEGVIKPDPIIFHRAIERFGINPATSLFVDDNPRNVTAAAHAGFQTMVFTGEQPLRRRISAGLPTPGLPTL